MPADKDIFGDPATTPFVRFVQGRALYPPTKIYESAEIVVQRLATHDLAAIFSELVEKGDCGGYYGGSPSIDLVCSNRKFSPLQSSTGPRPVKLARILHRRLEADAAQAAPSRTA